MILPPAVRIDLPFRRNVETVDVDYHGTTLTISVGRYATDGSPGEVWATTGLGGDMQHVLDDACVAISLMLQHGIAPRVIAKSLGRVPAHVIVDGAMVLRDGPASVFGVVVDLLCEVAE